MTEQKERRKYTKIYKKFIKPPDRKDIERAMLNTMSNKSAARYLGISPSVYKKYASQMFDENGVSLYEKHRNEAGKGMIKSIMSRRIGKSNLMELLEGKKNTVFISFKDIKKRIIHEGFLKEECSRCGFKEHRVLDMKVPLIVNYKDGNKRNWKLENLEFLCYNCFFITIADMYTEKQIEALEDYRKARVKTVDMELPAPVADKLKNLLDFNSRELSTGEDKYGEDIISYNK